MSTVLVISVLASQLAMMAIRAPHGQRSRRVPVAENRRGRLETFLLVLAGVTFFMPLLSLFTPLFDFAAQPFGIERLAAGGLVTLAGLWLLHRSHADLGTNWSVTLELREGHELVTRGIYGRVRHPMYLAFLVYGAGQALLVPNWVTGPAYLVAFALLVALRLGPEEQMMLNRFGPAYAGYMARTGRLLPKLQ